MNPKDISKFLSLVLRHDPGKIGISLDENGWTDCRDLIAAAGRHGIKFDYDTLVEVVRTVATSDEVVATATAVCRAIGKHPVECGDRAGFIVNALLFPYLNNAVRLLENGTATAEDIDTAMKGGCNFPMGPLALLDLVGLDTSVAIFDALYDEFRDPNYSVVPLMRRMVTAGQLGRKSGKGFYDYHR